MTKPSDFIKNSDYLSLANYDTVRTFSGTIPAGSSVLDQSFDFTLPESLGTIDRTLISIGGKNYITKNLYIYPTNDFGIMQVYRVNATTIRVRVYLYGNSGARPATPFSITLASFRPPNLF